MKFAFSTFATYANFLGLKFTVAANSMKKKAVQAMQA
jgi:hypothetical protein